MKNVYLISKLTHRKELYKLVNEPDLGGWIFREMGIQSRQFLPSGYNGHHKDRSELIRSMGKHPSLTVLTIEDNEIVDVK